MEVIVRNLHDQATEKQVDNFFRNVLDKLGIKTYACQKTKGRAIATITILDVQKARQFLQMHGQTEPGAKGFASVPQKLFYMRRPINCSVSNKPPDEFLLRSLKKEESDRYAASQSKTAKIVQGRVDENSRPGGNRRAFGISSLKCGQWVYVGDDLAFITYSQERRNGRIVFGQRNLLIKLLPEATDLRSYQIEIPYASIQSFATGPKTNPSVTFSLAEAPKLYETLIEKSSAPNGSALENAMRMVILREKMPVITRKRITSLSKAHENVVPSCLCYRIMLSNAGDVARVQALKRFPEIPSSISFNTSAVTKTPFAAQMTELNSALTGLRYSKMPFEVKFQMHRLARNGILAPSKVVELLAVVSHQLKSKDAATVAQSVRNLCDQVPYAGPDTEASELSLKALSEALMQNQELIIRGEYYSNSLAEQYDHIGSVHKAMVTPTGTYLYGPDPEVKNRVLRKYSAYPSHFLSVSFMDEDGEPLRLDRQTSGEDIYHGRFKAVLEGVIIIAGRGYEVCSPPLCTRFS